VLEPFQVAGGHVFMPLHLADREQHVAVFLTTAEGGHVNFGRLPLVWIGDRSAGDADGVSAAVDLWPGVPAGPLAADLLEMRADHAGVEGVLRALPDLRGAAGTFQVSPRRAHDRVIKGKQRLGDAVRRTVLLEGFRFVGDEPGVMQDA
jgi:hypothetical protein